MRISLIIYLLLSFGNRAFADKSPQTLSARRSCAGSYARLDLRPTQTDRILQRVEPPSIRNSPVAYFSGILGVSGALWGGSQWLAQIMNQPYPPPAPVNERSEILPISALRNLAQLRLREGMGRSRRSIAHAQGLGLLEFFMHAEFNQINFLNNQNLAEMREALEKDMEEVRRIARSTPNFDEKIDAIRLYLCRSHYKNYCWTRDRLSSFYLNECGNCVSQTLLLMGMLQAADIALPEGMELGVQNYPDHLRPVLIDRRRNRLQDLVTGQWTPLNQTIRAPIYRPNYLYYQFLHHHGFASPADPERDLLLRDTNVPENEWEPGLDLLAELPSGNSLLSYRPSRGQLFSREPPIAAWEMPCEMSGEAPPASQTPRERPRFGPVPRTGPTASTDFEAYLLNYRDRRTLFWLGVFLFRDPTHRDRVRSFIDQRRSAGVDQEGESALKILEFYLTENLVFYETTDEGGGYLQIQPEIVLGAAPSGGSGSPHLPFHLDRSARGLAENNFVFRKPGDLVVHNSSFARFLRERKPDEIPFFLWGQVVHAIHDLRRDSAYALVREFVRDPWRATTASPAERRRVDQWIAQWRAIAETFSEIRQLYLGSYQATTAFRAAENAVGMLELFQAGLAANRSVAENPEAALRRFIELTGEQRQSLFSFVNNGLGPFSSLWRRRRGSDSPFHIPEANFDWQDPSQPFMGLMELLVSPERVRLRDPVLRGGEIAIPIDFSNLNLPIPQEAPPVSLNAVAARPGESNPSGNPDEEPNQARPQAILLDSGQYLALLAMNSYGLRSRRSDQMLYREGMGDSFRQQFQTEGFWSREKLAHLLNPNLMPRWVGNVDVRELRRASFRVIRSRGVINLYPADLLESYLQAAPEDAEPVEVMPGVYSGANLFAGEREVPDSDGRIMRYQPFRLSDSTEWHVEKTTFGIYLLRQPE
jgi:hypothetical protein